MKREQISWGGVERPCPACGTVFKSISNVGQCPSCKKIFDAADPDRERRQREAATKHVTQTFFATKVTVESDADADNETIIGFLDRGPRHGFMIVVPEVEEGARRKTRRSRRGEVYVEHCDQINGCDGNGLQGVRLRDDRLEVDFDPKAGLHPREMDEVQEETLTRLVVTFKVAKPLLRRVRDALARLEAFGCPFVYEGRRLAEDP